MPKNIKYLFKKDDDYRIIPANGVWGGPTPRGDIRADFFCEFESLPKEIHHAVDEDGRLGQELKRIPSTEDITIQRNFLVGMILTVEQADSIGRWLQKKAREVRERTKTEGAGENERDSPTTH